MLLASILVHPSRKCERCPSLRISCALLPPKGSKSFTTSNLTPWSRYILDMMGSVIVAMALRSVPRCLALPVFAFLWLFVPIAYKIDNAVQVRANIMLKEKHNCRYPRIEEGDYVKVFDKGKGNYTSRKETRNQCSERNYRVNLKSRGLTNNTFYKLEGFIKRYNWHEMLLLKD